jgi:sugar phosphate isomerase/epimerase
MPKQLHRDIRAIRVVYCISMKEFSRRGFLKAGAVAAAAATTTLFDVSVSAAGVPWPIGCFNRPWMQKFGSRPQPLSTLQPANWGFDAALKGIKEAGFLTVGLLTPMPEEPFLAADVSDDYLAGLKKRIAASDLTATMGSLRGNFSSPLDDVIKQVRRQIDHAALLNAEWLLTFGVDKKDDYANYCRAMADAADYAQERKVKMVLKPHGGSSGSSEEIIRCLKDVGRPNFKIWYDAGNIIYYTGKDPVEELKPIARYVTGFCAKDCAAPNSDVMIQFGAGKVDFPGVFGELKKAGFNGPTFIECAGGKTFQEVTDSARANRIFLEKVFASL